MWFSKPLLLSFVAGFAAHACTPVEGDRILGKHLAAADARFAKINLELALGLAPMPGAVRTFSKGELAAAGKRGGLALTSLPKLPESLCFALATEPLEKAQVQSALEDALGEHGVEITAFSPEKFPHGRLEFTRSGLEVSGLWRGRMIYGTRSAAVWARIKVEESAGRLGDNSGSGGGMVPRVAPVQRGDSLTVEVRAGAARLKLQARAESAGRAGDSILLRNPANGRIFQAKVLGKGQAIVVR